MIKPRKPSEVEHIDTIRKAMIVRRNKALGPEKFDAEDAVLFSQVIAWLGYAESLDRWVESDYRP